MIENSIIIPKDGNKTVYGQVAHALYFNGDYEKRQCNSNMALVYELTSPKETPILRAAQYSPELAMQYMGENRVMVIFTD